MSDSIIVAVRCRPFNRREIALGSKLIVTMNNQLITLHDSNDADRKEDKKFTFDYSYWSFANDDTATETSPFATNATVYNDIGKVVLNNAIEGVFTQQQQQQQQQAVVTAFQL